MGTDQAKRILKCASFANIGVGIEYQSDPLLDHKKPSIGFVHVVEVCAPPLTMTLCLVIVSSQ